MMTKPEKAQRRKAFAFLDDLEVGQMFELPSESGMWVKADRANQDKLIPVQQYANPSNTKRLPKHTTVILDV